jgi:hypothetical protein
MAQKDVALFGRQGFEVKLSRASLIFVMTSSRVTP